MPSCSMSLESALARLQTSRLFLQQERSCTIWCLAAIHVCQEAAAGGSRLIALSISSQGWSPLVFVIWTIFPRLAPVFVRISFGDLVTGGSSCNNSVIVPANGLRGGWRNLLGMNSALAEIQTSLMSAPRPWIQTLWRIGKKMTGSIASRPCRTVGLPNEMEIRGSDRARSGCRQHWEQMTC